ncbi:MAG TPA: hypothetical protein VN670_02345 [Acidobacteriaceae bacterium]|nr:hypothetical protein [Acidobacteriaceae bacterium]
MRKLIPFRTIPSFTTALFLLMSVFAFHPAAHATDRHGRKYQPPPPMGQVAVTVLRASDDKPVHNAAVVFHPKSEDGKDDGNMELKTNENGIATLNIVPIGSKVLVQVIAPGYRTFGKEYDVAESINAFTIRLLPPNQQYSTYEKGSHSAKSDLQTNTPQTQMGAAAPADSPLLVAPEKKKSDEH